MTADRFPLRSWCRDRDDRGRVRCFDCEGVGRGGPAVADCCRCPSPLPACGRGDPEDTMPALGTTGLEVLMKTTTTELFTVVILAVALSSAAQGAPGIADWAEGPEGVLLTETERATWGSITDDAGGGGVHRPLLGAAGSGLVDPRKRVSNRVRYARRGCRCRVRGERGAWRPL